MRYAMYYRLSDGRNETEVVDNSKDRDIRAKYIKMFIVRHRTEREVEK